MKDYKIILDSLEIIKALDRFGLFVFVSVMVYVLLLFITYYVYNFVMNELEDEKLLKYYKLIGKRMKISMSVAGVFIGLLFLSLIPIWLYSCNRIENIFKELKTYNKKEILDFYNFHNKEFYIMIESLKNSSDSIYYNTLIEFAKKDVLDDLNIDMKKQKY